MDQKSLIRQKIDRSDRTDGPFHRALRFNSLQLPTKVYFFIRYVDYIWRDLWWEYAYSDYYDILWIFIRMQMHIYTENSW